MRSDAAAAAADAGLADYHGAIVEHGFERHVGGGGGIDAAGDLQDLGGTAYGVGEVAGDVGQRGQKEIAEAVAFETAAGFEAVLKKPREQGVVFGERHHAVADVAGGQHVELAAQASGTAAVVGDGNDGGDIDHRFVFAVPIAVGMCVFFEAVQQRRETVAATDGDYPEGFSHPFSARAACSKGRFEQRSQCRKL